MQVCCPLYTELHCSSDLQQQQMMIRTTINRNSPTPSPTPRPILASSLRPPDWPTFAAHTTPSAVTKLRIYKPIIWHLSVSNQSVDLHREYTIWILCKTTHSDNFYRATACNATHGIAVVILSISLSVHLSVCPPVRCVYCDKTKWRTVEKSTADRLKRCQLSSPVSVINIWWSAAMFNVHHIHGWDLYSAARPSRRNCLITIVTPVVYPRFLEFLYIDIQSTGHTLSLIHIWRCRRRG